MSKVRVAILCGGRSSEHGVSCVSARGVMDAIDRTKFEPILIGITKSGSWVLLADDHDFSIHDGQMPEVPSSALAVQVDVSGLSSDGKPLNIDAIFPLLHGPYGEDGSIQGLCETLNIPFVGSGILSSAVAMDKSFAKPIFASHGIATAPGFVIKKSEWSSKALHFSEQAQSLGYPLFVKAARGGSSKGTFKVKSPIDFSSAVEAAHAFDQKVMVEKAIVGDEIECAVLEIDGEVRASVVGKIVIDSKYEFYDFEAKYLDSATTIELPAPIDAQIAQAIQKGAIEAFNALGCSGFARVDFFLTPDKKIVINELNTLPGFTATSVFPKMWQATGVSYSQVITALIESALRHENGVLGR